MPVRSEVLPNDPTRFPARKRASAGLWSPRSRSGCGHGRLPRFPATSRGRSALHRRSPPRRPICAPTPRPASAGTRQSRREVGLDRLRRALRMLTRYNEAVAVMQTAAVKAPKDEDVLGEYGKALADAGELAQAKDVLTRAYTPDDPKWDIMSVQGAVADRWAITRPRCSFIVSPEDRAGGAGRPDQHGAVPRPFRGACRKPSAPCGRRPQTRRRARGREATSRWCWRSRKIRGSRTGEPNGPLFRGRSRRRRSDPAAPGRGRSASARRQGRRRRARTTPAN